MQRGGSVGLPEVQDVSGGATAKALIDILISVDTEDGIFRGRLNKRLVAASW